MHEPIRYRGPDGEGFLLVDSEMKPRRFDRISDATEQSADILGFAFRRLRILDLTDAASQPMESHDGRAWIVFNGEIYDFAELRRQLEAGGDRKRHV